MQPNGTARRVSRGRVEVECQRCSTAFVVYLSRFKAGGVRFCGMRCAKAVGSKQRVPRSVRLWRRVVKTETCWLWQGAQNRAGYGKMGNGDADSQIATHVAAWEEASGAPVPDGLYVLHTCDTPACCRNDEAGTYAVDGRLLPRWGHLFLGTQNDNMLDKVAKGRGARGERMGNAVLTEALVLEIQRRHAAREKTKDIARTLGFHPSTIDNVIQGRAWSHVCQLIIQVHV